MWMEAFLEVLFCVTPRCHCTNNTTGPVDISLINLVKFQILAMLLNSLILELHVNISTQSAFAKI